MIHKKREKVERERVNSILLVCIFHQLGCGDLELSPTKDVVLKVSTVDKNGVSIVFIESEEAVTAFQVTRTEQKLETNASVAWVARGTW